MNNKTQLFPQNDLVSEDAEALLAGKNLDENSLLVLERRILNWITQPDNLSQSSHPHNYVLELPEITLAAGSRAPAICVVTQRTMRVRRLLLFSSKPLSHVKILRFMVGFEEPAQIREGMSAELFRVMSRHPPIQEGIYLNPGMSCTLLLENTGPEEVSISGAILGATLTY